MKDIKSLKIGVLALQGAFSKHINAIQALGASAFEVRTPAQLAMCDALIIPGGESTTIFRQLDFIHMLEPLSIFAQKKPLFGTCAGLILMSSAIEGSTFPKPFQLLDITVERNAYGRQIESFRTEIAVKLPKQSEFVMPAFFIRAPRIKRQGPEVITLASHHEEPILIQQGIHMGATFHPELSEETRIHRYFLSLVVEAKGTQEGV